MSQHLPQTVLKCIFEGYVAKIYIFFLKNKF